MNRDSLLTSVLLALSGCTLAGGGGDGGPGADAGPAGDAAAPACDGIEPEGSCDGDVLTYCAEGALVVFDCDTHGDFACVEDIPGWGADCIAPLGAPCGVIFDDGTDASYLCDGAASGCVWGEDTTACTADVGSCTAADVGTCFGDLHVFACRAGQVAANDCASWGGRCDAGRCVDVAEGRWCGADYFGCASGLACVDGACERVTPVGGDLTITLRESSVVRTEPLRDHRLHLYTAEPYYYMGNRPADVPEPLATSAFVDFVAVFEDVPDGRYWYDFAFLAETGRIGYAVGMVDVVGDTSVVAEDWSYTSYDSVDFLQVDQTDPWGFIAVYSDDPAIPTTQGGVYLHIDDVTYTGVSNRIRNTVSDPGSTRCGEVSIDRWIVVMLSPGPHDVGARAFDPSANLLIWDDDRITVVANACSWVDLGRYDRCTGC